MTRIIIILLIGLSVFSTNPRSSLSKEIEIIPIDMVTMPGMEIYPQAGLFKRGMFSLITRPVTGAKLEFLHKGKKMGVALTGGDGIGAIRYFPLKEGIYIFKIHPLEDAIEEEMDMVIAVWDLEKPIYLIEGDTLIKRQKGFILPGLGKRKKEPEEGAKEILTYLTRKGGIVYFVHNTMDIPSMKRWLDIQSFPVYPVMDKSHLKDLINRRQKAIKGVVTRPAYDIHFFLDNSLKVYVISGKNKESKDKHIKYIKDWKTLKRIIQGHGTHD